MKATTILIALCALLLSLTGCGAASSTSFVSTGDGGWECMKPLPSNQNWSAVCFIDDKTGWIAGSDCAILKTTDGGRNWAPQGPRRCRFLHSICFIDKDHGWAAGEGFLGKDGIILKTSNGGATWRIAREEAEDGFLGVRFVSSSTGWAFTRKQVLKTTDGGETWEKQSSGLPGNLSIGDTSFPDRNNGWLVGDRRGLYRTQDGGSTWAVAEVPGKEGMSKVQFVDTQTGWALSSGGIRRTTDGGKTWTEHSFAKAFPPSKQYPGKTFAQSFHFHDALHGVAADYSGNIIYTSDGGQTWSLAAVPKAALSFPVVRLTDKSNGWAVGNYGAIVKTSDGGATWQEVSRGSGGCAMGVCFADGRTGWVVGHTANSVRGDTPLQPEILKTEDGGQTWSSTVVPADRQQLLRVQFLDKNTGWAVGDGPEGVMVKTTDAGQTWKPQNYGSNARLSSLHFFDKEHGWATGAEGAAIGTMDGGAHWTKLNTGTMDQLYAVFFTDKNTGWIAGIHGRIMKTIDGGATWKRQGSGVSTHISSLFFVNKRLGWASGGEGTILHTTDGGETWTKQESGCKKQLVSIRFLDENVGWAAGGCAAQDGDVVLHTVNGGQTWTVGETGVWDGLWDVHFTDADHGWAVGRSVFRTTTGGLPGVVWAKKQPDGKQADFGHLVITKKSPGFLLAEHPESRIGVHIKTSDDKPAVGDYIYVHGKIATESGEKIIAADSIDIQCAGWGILPAK